MLEANRAETILNSLSKDDLLKLQSTLQKILQTEYQPTASIKQIPLKIFSNGLSPAEALVKYMKENMEMNFHEIGGAICRDERGIWGSYNRAKKKNPDKYRFEIDTAIPIEVFSDRKKSILEAAIAYLVDEKRMKFSEIARKLGKKYTTIYTTYMRAKKKEGEQ